MIPFPTNCARKPDSRDAELLAREIHIAHRSLTEPSPENGRALFASRSTEGEHHSMSPELPKNKRRKTTTAIVENASHASEARRRKSTVVYGSKGSSQPDCEIYGSSAEKRQTLREGENGGRDLWEFPGSSASDDPLGPRREAGSTRVKSRNARGDATNVGSCKNGDGKQSSAMKESFDTRDILSHDDKDTKSANSHGINPLGESSFKIDLTDPTLVLTASQKEQYQQLSTTTSTAGSLPSPLLNELSLINSHEKFSDASSTIPNSTPSKHLQAVGVEISPFPESSTSLDVSVTSVAMQSPSQTSQTSSKIRHTPRRSKSALSLLSPDGNNSTASTNKKKADMSIPTSKPKRRSKTTTSVLSQYAAEEDGGLSLPGTVLDIPNTTAPKTTKKRKAKDVDELGSDDVAIGLPKEEYKPRPSRSRGNTNLDGLLESLDFSKRPEAQIKAKNKRRKTHESDVPKFTDEAALIQADKPTGEEANEQAVGTTNPVPDPPEAAIVHEEDVIEIVDDDTPSLPKPVTLKRKRLTDDMAEHDANASTAHPQTDNKAAPSATPKQPAPKPRGRPRKKTEEKAPAIAIISDLPPQTPDPAHPPVTIQHPSPGPTTALAETSPNLNPNTHTTPSDARIHRPSTPPPQHTAPLTLPTTPSQNPTDPLRTGPQKHSPLNSGRVPYRVGLSRRARIEPLLRGFRK